MTVYLNQVKEGARVIVKAIGPEEVTWQALRFGLEEGSCLTVEKSLPGGPVIVSKNQLEIAIGQPIARLIEIEYLA